MYAGSFSVVLRTLIVAVIVVFAAAWFAVNKLSGNEVKTKTRLVPIRYELIVSNNKVDTIFVYKKP